MFKKLKNKLKDWTTKVADAEDEVKELEEIQEEEEIEEPQEEEKVEKKSFFKKIFSKKDEEITEDKENIKTPKEEIEEKSNIITKEENKKLKEETKKENLEDKNLKKSKKEKPKSSPKNSDPEQTSKTGNLGKTKNESINEKSKEEKRKEDINKKEAEETKEPKPEEPEIKKKRSIFSKLSSKKTISEEEFEEHAEDLEMILLENNVALEVVDKILEEIKEKIVNQELSKKEILEKITKSLSEKIKEVLQEPFSIEKEIEEKIKKRNNTSGAEKGGSTSGPYIILFCGINGTGKTTTISKIANMFKEKGKSVVMAAGDTFRAAAVEQLKAHGEKLDIKVIAHDYGADPAAVGFDAIKYAEKNKIDIVLIDTAGRIHTATNLIREMEKIKRVCKPDRTLFVGESITGNDAVDQVKAFNDNIGIDGIVLSKADIDEKGGTALSVGYITKKPIIFLGTGQNYKDIEFFNKQKFLEKLELE